MKQGTQRKWSIFALLAVFLCLVACHATPTSESTGEYIDDSTITTKVKSDLLGAKDIPSNSISVETFKGVVQLSGFVSTADQARHAGEVAAKVGGVKVVHNNLIVKTQQ